VTVSAARPPGRTVRLRLTLLYSGLVLLSGVVLVTITFLLLTSRLGAPVRISVPGEPPVPDTAAGKVSVSVPRQLQAQRLGDLHQFLIQSGIALGITGVLALALGWVIAGRVLRPLRVMTATTRQISEQNLHRRLALPGPRDELTDLGNTIDGLLARLENAFDAQRRFVANASHELRTPLALARVTLQVALADPAVSLDSLRSACLAAIEAGRQQEQLIEALLTLARGQRGPDHWETFDLALVAGDVVRSHGRNAAAREVTLHSVLSAAPVSGDRRLVQRLVSNLVDNALRYNVPHGQVTVLAGVRARQGTLRVTNTGPIVPADHIDRLLQPFQRLDPDRTGQPDGHGLGLSIVAAIATAHAAVLDANPGQHGGLDIEVTFPA
jgi:signal transduction histidine kinase